MELIESIPKPPPATEATEVNVPVKPFQVMYFQNYWKHELKKKIPQTIFVTATEILGKTIEFIVNRLFKLHIERQNDEIVKGENGKQKNEIISLPFFTFPVPLLSG